MLRRASPESLATQVHSFAEKIQPEEEGAVLLYISGEVRPVGSWGVSVRD